MCLFCVSFAFVSLFLVYESYVKCKEERKMKREREEEHAMEEDPIRAFEECTLCEVRNW